MSLISGVWIATIQSYQALSLKFGQQEQKRAHIRDAWNAFELGVDKRVLRDESARVSSRDRLVDVATKPITQNKR